MNDGDFVVRMVPLPGTIGGAVRLSEDGFANIYINDNMSQEARKKAFDHERRHIENNDFFSDRSIVEIETE